MQSQVLALEDGKRDLEAKVLQEHQELETALAKNKELSDQVQAIAKSLEEKCRVAVSEADQKMTLLQVSHVWHKWMFFVCRQSSLICLSLATP